MRISFEHPEIFLMSFAVASSNCRVSHNLGSVLEDMLRNCVRTLACLHQFRLSFINISLTSYTYRRNCLPISPGNFTVDNRPFSSFVMYC